MDTKQAMGRARTANELPADIKAQLNAELVLEWHADNHDLTEVKEPTRSYMAWVNDSIEDVHHLLDEEEDTRWNPGAMRGLADLLDERERLFQLGLA